MLLLLNILFVSISAAIAQEKVYDGFKVYDIKVKSTDDLKFLKNLETFAGDEKSLDFFSFHNNVDDKVKLLVGPKDQNYIEELFGKRKLEFSVIDDVQKYANFCSICRSYLVC